MVRGGGDVCAVQAKGGSRQCRTLFKLAAEWEPRVLSIVRIIAGLMFMEHGLGKLAGFHTCRTSRRHSISSGSPASLNRSVGSWLRSVCSRARRRSSGLGEMAVAYFMARATGFLSHAERR